MYFLCAKPALVLFCYGACQAHNSDPIDILLWPALYCAPRPPRRTQRCHPSPAEFYPEIAGFFTVSGKINKLANKQFC